MTLSFNEHQQKKKTVQSEDEYHCCKLVTPAFYHLTISSCKKPKANVIIRVGFEEEVGAAIHVLI